MMLPIVHKEAPLLDKEMDSVSDQANRLYPCERLIGDFRIYAHYGRNLPDEDGWLNESDPYLEVIAYDADGNSVTRRSSYRQGNLNPVWNQWLYFGIRTWK